MTIGPIIAGIGTGLLSRTTPGTSYWTTTFPAAIVLGIGLTITVAPLTAAVLGAVSDDHMGVGSAINNAVARIAGLLAVAVLPAAAGLAGAGGTLDLVHGFGRAMMISGALAAFGGVLAALTISKSASVTPVPQATPLACNDPALRQASAA
jgi:hypothetical protein